VDRLLGEENVSAPRLFVAALGAPGETLALPEEESRHVRSRRLVDGAPVVLLDGRGGRAAGTLFGGGREVVMGERIETHGEPARCVTVVLAVAEPPRVEWAIEKGTECGAAAFLLAACERSQAAHVRALASRLSRLSRIAGEAVKQCDRTRVPSIAPPRPFSEVLASIGVPVWLARRGAPPPGGAVPAAIAIAIGPEGGFSGAEDALLVRAGAVPFGLGARTLRMETATVAALSLLVDSS
jgi:16S rRNA (uracil1498-N3)-methyltransferase